jgi:CheY-like chemotaxis protein
MYKQILLIDDDRDDAQVFMEALEQMDNSLQFIRYEDEETAMNALQQKRGPRPDIIFLDINMPKLTGWDCLTRIKAHPELSQIPVFMYTTSSRDTEKMIAKDLGASGFITKPTNFEALKGVLQQYLYPTNGQA